MVSGARLNKFKAYKCVYLDISYPLITFSLSLGVSNYIAMLQRILLLSMMLCLSLSSMNAQNARVKKGNKYLAAQNFSCAIKKYLKALDKKDILEALNHV